MASGDFGNLYGWIGDFIRQGYSMREGIKAFREAGGRIGNERFRSTWRSVADSLIQFPTVTSLPVDQVPGQQHFLPWSTTTNKDRFGQQVTLHVWDQDIGGVIQRDWMVMSDDPMTPEEAMQYAIDEFNDAVDENAAYGGQRATAATLRGLYRTV